MNLGYFEPADSKNANSFAVSPLNLEKINVQCCIFYKTSHFQRTDT
jgi:hypothetical protein